MGNALAVAVRSLVLQKKCNVLETIGVDYDVVTSIIDANL